MLRMLSIYIYGQSEWNLLIYKLILLFNSNLQLWKANIYIIVNINIKEGNTSVSTLQLITNYYFIWHITSHPFLKYFLLEFGKHKYLYLKSPCSQVASTSVNFLQVLIRYSIILDWRILVLTSLMHSNSITNFLSSSSMGSFVCKWVVGPNFFFKHAMWKMSGNNPFFDIFREYATWTTLFSIRWGKYKLGKSLWFL